MCVCMCGWVCVLCVCVSECVCVCLLYECACFISVRACMNVCVCLSEIFPCSVFVFSLIHGSVLCVCRFDWHIWRSTVFYQKIFLFFWQKKVKIANQTEQRWSFTIMRVCSCITDPKLSTDWFQNFVDVVLFKLSPGWLSVLYQHRCETN